MPFVPVLSLLSNVMHALPKELVASQNKGVLWKPLRLADNSGSLLSLFTIYLPSADLDQSASGGTYLTLRYSAVVLRGKSR